MLVSEMKLIVIDVDSGVAIYIPVLRMKRVEKST